mmetsp:Transcript_50186/g.51071  ORF Transcript_50186/g.51071 Transcript_50186/m.51071 type:complete len:405 (+) Transcript_50186:419-1633(+)
MMAWNEGTNHPERSSMATPTPQQQQNRQMPAGPPSTTLPSLPLRPSQEEEAISMNRNGNGSEGARNNDNRRHHQQQQQQLLQSKRYADVRTSRMSITSLKDRTDLDETVPVPVPPVVKTNFVDENGGDIYKTAIRRTLWWVGAAIAYGFLLIFVVGPETSSEFYAGYILEQSLSIDNLLVFLLLFEYFKIPLEYQNRVLNWGIIGSIVMRATMIGFGSVALQNFREVLLVFAGILLYSSAKVIAGDDEDDEDDLSENSIVKFANNIMGSTDQFDGDRFFTEIDGVRMATPMLLCMISVEVSDVVFAVDSIPAIFGVTEDPLVVFSSNMFAIMGLRSLYVILSKAASDLKYLEKAVAVVLGFIGAKLIAEYLGYTISTESSLAVVVTVLGIGVATSLLDKSEENE